MATAKQVIDTALAEVGYDRYQDPLSGTKYGRWYAEGHGHYYGTNGVPFCAMFCSWVLNEAGATCAGFPSAYCPDIHLHQHLSPSQLQYGDVVLFDWEDDGTDDHVGFVISNNGSYIHTVEGNVNSGKVLERDRPYSTVCGGIRPNYDGAAEKPSEPLNLVARLQTQLNAQTGAGLAVDGEWGQLTKAAASRNSALLRRGDRGEMTRILQEALNGKGYSLETDSIFGIATQSAVTDFQIRNAANGLEVDGIVGGETWERLLI